jgi:hypothetical protein
MYVVGGGAAGGSFKHGNRTSDGGSLVIDQMSVGEESVRMDQKQPKKKPIRLLGENRKLGTGQFGLD